MYYSVLFVCIVLACYTNQEPLKRERRQVATCHHCGDFRVEPLCAQSAKQLITFKNKCYVECHNENYPGDAYIIKYYGYCGHPATHPPPTHNPHNQPYQNKPNYTGQGTKNTVVVECESSRNCKCSDTYSPVCARGGGREVIKFRNICQMACHNSCFRGEDYYKGDSSLSC